MTLIEKRMRERNRERKGDAERGELSAKGTGIARLKSGLGRVENKVPPRFLLLPSREMFMKGCHHSLVEGSAPSKTD